MHKQEENIEEFPKMLYKHPNDKAQEHTFVTVNTAEEEKQAKSDGYKPEPHVPVVKQDNGIEKDQPTKNPEVIPHKQDSPKTSLRSST